MKILSATLAVLLSVVACGPVTRSHPKTVGSEADEETASALEKPELTGPILDLTEDGRALLARKQGKVWRRSQTLRVDERAEILRVLRYLDVASIQVKDLGVALVLSGRYFSLNRQSDRDLAVTLKQVPENPGRYEGEFNGQDFVVTCLPRGEGKCLPEAGSVIEVLSKQTMSNYKPRTLAFLYGHTSISASMRGDLTGALGAGASGKLSSIVVLNREAKVSTYLSMDMETVRGQRLQFSAHYQPGPNEFFWSILSRERSPGYQLAGSPPVKVERNGIAIPLLSTAGKALSGQVDVFFFNRSLAEL